MPHPPSSSGRHKLWVAMTSAVLVAGVFAGQVAASGPVVTVEPVGPLPLGAQTITVSGQGFDPVGNHGNGVYVVYGPITPAPGYYLDASVYAAFKWVHPTGQASGAEALLAADGSFSTTLDIPSSFTTQTGVVDCAAVDCAVITFGAHGSQDRSQDTCTLVRFVTGGASAPAGPGTSGAPAVSPVISTAAPSMAAPFGSTMPTVSAAPGDPCAPITATAGR